MGDICLGPFARGRSDLPEPPSPTQAAACAALIRLAIVGLAQLRRQECGRLGWSPTHPSLIAVLDRLTADPVREDAATLAARVRISPSRLQHLCRSELGISLLALRDRHLLERARQLLLDPAVLPIKRVADRLGFRDQRAFATWFRRMVGKSPSDWRLHEAV